MAIKVDADVVLLDIEGTVCPITFVKDVLFPYALEALPSVLATQWDSPTFAPYRDAFPAEHSGTPSALLSHVQDLMSRDVKIAYLKSLQGYLWQSGYSSGALVCPLFPDVEPCLRKWHANGIRLIIYSSGSVAAQKLLFQHTNSAENKDMRDLLSGFFDTVNAGLKQEKESYERILKSEGADGEKGRWLFLSDNVREVEAALEAGMQSLVVVREGNMVISDNDKERFTLVKSFEEIEIQKGSHRE